MKRFAYLMALVASFVSSPAPPRRSPPRDPTTEPTHGPGRGRARAAERRRSSRRPGDARAAAQVIVLEQRNDAVRPDDRATHGPGAIDVRAGDPGRAGSRHRAGRVGGSARRRLRLARRRHRRRCRARSRPDRRRRRGARASPNPFTQRLAVPLPGWNRRREMSTARGPRRVGRERAGRMHRDRLIRAGTATTSAWRRGPRCGPLRRGTESRSPEARVPPEPRVSRRAPILSTAPGVQVQPRSASASRYLVRRKTPLEGLYTLLRVLLHESPHAAVDRLRVQGGGSDASTMAFSSDQRMPSGCCSSSSKTVS